MEKNAKIYVAGHGGMVGSAIVRALKREGYTNIVGRTHHELDLTRQKDTEAFFEAEKPEYVFLAAAKVGGIGANSSYPVEFGIENIRIACNVLEAAHSTGVRKLLYLGSACTYPNSASVPVRESEILSGCPERTNEAYALAKIFGVRLCSYFRKEYGDDFIAVTPANCYGENDRFDPHNSHVIPALIQKCHQAKETGAKQIELWGSGQALREFIYVDDLADACIFLMNRYSGNDHINVGSGHEITILDLAKMIGRLVGFSGEIVCDTTKPDGKPRNRIDSSKLFEMGWRPACTMEAGIQKLYDWYLSDKRINT